MIKRLNALAAYLELDDDELRAITQMIALAIFGAFLLFAVLVFGAIVLGAAYRLFTCTGGLSC